MMEEKTEAVGAHGWSRHALEISVRSAGIRKDKKETVM